MSNDQEVKLPSKKDISVLNDKFENSFNKGWNSAIDVINKMFNERPSPSPVKLAPLDEEEVYAEIINKSRPPYQEWERILARRICQKFGIQPTNQPAKPTSDKPSSEVKEFSGYIKEDSPKLEFPEAAQVEVSELESLGEGSISKPTKIEYHFPDCRHELVEVSEVEILHVLNERIKGEWGIRDLAITICTYLKSKGIKVI